MGIAAYNRGTAVLRRQIDASLPSSEEILLHDLNAVRKGGIVLFGPTVIRRAEDGLWWVMNHPEKGWASYGRYYPTLWAIAREYAFDFLGFGQDEHSMYVAVQPAAK